MRNKFKPTCSKSLVRNAEVPVAPALTSKGNTNDNDCRKSHTARNRIDQTNQNAVGDKISLGEPVLNSTLRIVKEMKQTSEMKPLRVQNPPDFFEKVTQKINVPYNEHLYHDLVALSVCDTPLVESTSNVKVKRHKQDPTPDLTEYIHTHCVPDIPVVVSHRFSHHNLLPGWNECNVSMDVICFRKN